MLYFSQGKKEDEVPEEEVDMPPIGRLIKLNAGEWPYLVIGSVFAAVVGAFPVVFAIILSEILKVHIPISTNILFFWLVLFFIYIHKSYDTNLQYWQKVHTTILLERYPREQTTMTTPGPFGHIN